MFVESLIEETEGLLEKITLQDLVKLWNNIFPEEKIDLKSAKDYSLEIVEELRSMIVDELQDTGLERLIMIHNQLAEDQISEEDIYEEFDDYNDFEDEIEVNL
jgi:hypothetical protein